MKNWDTRTGGCEVTQGLATAGRHSRDKWWKERYEAQGLGPWWKIDLWWANLEGAGYMDEMMPLLTPTPSSPLPYTSQPLSSSHPLIFCQCLPLAEPS